MLKLCFITSELKLTIHVRLVVQVPRSSSVGWETLVSPIANPAMLGYALVRQGVPWVACAVDAEAHNFVPCCCYMSTIRSLTMCGCPWCTHRYFPKSTTLVVSPQFPRVVSSQKTKAFWPSAGFPKASPQKPKHFRGLQLVHGIATPKHSRSTGHPLEGDPTLRAESIPWWSERWHRGEVPDITTG